ncbi:RsmF rRNA methyltransferase first C-terminal domain-containing protein [Anaerotignum propionicum]|uniref:RsmF rRNA methyltransferase first C-terminal domain-containing protein n=1 Tax=Anaerotignum propionicum TaxID=28446 RepID=UPI00210B7133|nr:RsmB/NOP family class I SAM-dependent RNA methyltransferase [Anaerotignum propionicum]MCQ4934798.1 RsmB/NOP family class I SAM-dependent RNA methyltransferase [Anaerotignum propionicum]
MELPIQYTEKMKKLLGDEYSKYLESFEESRYFGLRVNSLKLTPKMFRDKNVFSLTSVPWCREGFYYAGEQRPSKHPYYHAGLYYLQEPSAMSPGAILPIQPGERVLDVCAAPGGKSTQLGARLQGEGLLVANDISAGRAKALLKNIELFGIRNSVVMSEPPERLKERLPNFFDKILIDAPCSGEGMFRKEPDMVKSWNEEMLVYCQKEQGGILEACAGMLRPGGMMLYSTCTFAVEENEKSISDFLERHQEFSLVPIEKENGFSAGMGALAQCARLYPHKIKGEGHFLALMQKTEEGSQDLTLEETGEKEKDILPYLEFEKEVLKIKLSGTFKIFGDSLYLLPEGMPAMKGLRVLRTGWQLGTMKKGRFEPSQAFAMGLSQGEVTNVEDFSLADDRVIRYLKGETVEADGKEGWTLVCVDGLPLGWAKRQGGRLKNKYAVGWKWE